jgi:hypothetical protein
MAKKVHDSVLDGALNILRNGVNQLIVCSSEPADRAAALAAALAAVATDSSDFTIANGDTNGRKVTVGAQNGITATASGDATHIALVDSTTLLYVTTCTTQAITSGNPVNVPAFDIEIADPA